MMKQRKVEGRLTGLVLVRLIAMMVASLLSIFISHRFCALPFKPPLYLLR
jgi:uncharacterized protein HemY